METDLLKKNIFLFVVITLGLLFLTTTFMATSAEAGECQFNPCIDMTKTGPETASPGDTITYDFTVTNCGDIAFRSGAQCKDFLLGGQIFQGDLLPEEIKEFSWDYTVTIDDCGELKNIAKCVGYPEENICEPTHIVKSWTVDVDCEEELGCRLTGGGVNTSGINPDGGWDGTTAKGSNRSLRGAANRYQFGGQVGANTGQQPQPKGEWTHHQQRGTYGSFIFHAGTASAPPGTEIDEIICSDPGYCDPARPAPNKQLDFAGVGVFKNIKSDHEMLAGVEPGVTYHWVEVHTEDNGEPGKEPKPGQTNKNIICDDEGSRTDAFAEPPVFFPANCDCADFYRIKIYEGVIPVFDPITGEVTNPNKNNVIYQVWGYLDGGNLQIHPPTGFDLK
jgi:uncharacterized repeat protein (TIGR01451 family)